MVDVCPGGNMKPLDKRQKVLGAALVATLAATAWFAQQPDDTPVIATAGDRRPTGGGSVSRSAPLPRPASAFKPSEASLPLERQAWAKIGAAQLAAWQPAPPPAPPPALAPAPPAPPAPPIAPALPYQMVGRVIEGEGANAVEVALLNGPTRSLAVSRGEVIDGQWRVDHVSSNGVRLTWLPGQIPQQIAFRAIP